jgi:HSP20 family protein
VPATLRNGSFSSLADSPVNRLSSWLDQFYSNGFWGPQRASQAEPAAVLPMSIWDDEDHLYIEMDAPGISEKDIDVSLHDGELIIRGERKRPHDSNGFDTRRYGQFEQRVTVPAMVDANRVEAKLAEGVLRVTLPKAPESKPRKIPVKQ